MYPNIRVLLIIGCTLPVRGGCSKGASFTSRIQVNGKQPRNIITYKRDWWEGVWGRSNLRQKSPAVLSEPKFGLSQKFLDPPLLSISSYQF